MATTKKPTDPQPIALQIRGYLRRLDQLDDIKTSVEATLGKVDAERREINNEIEQLSRRIGG